MARVVMDAALEGDMQACNMVLQRLSPPLRARAEKVTFGLTPDAPLHQQANQVLASVAEGAIDPETGKLLIDCIQSVAGAGKTTTASEKPCTALIVVSGAVARSPGEAAPSHREPLDVNQTDSARNGVTPAPCDLAFDTAAWRCCRLWGCASVAGGWGDDHHTAAARVLAATVRGL